ncbi:MAG: bifunctional 5,10-methylenetetrahydrofolate dehydrogenase/5,10-methenyltetrahydrofolate cyclohydrolase [Patescibacteria group bacterium]
MPEAIDLLKKMRLSLFVLYNSKPIIQQFETYLNNNLKALDKQLELDVVQVGNDFASTKYVGIKQKLGSKLGIKVNKFLYQDGVDKSKILTQRDEKSKPHDGLIFQLPIPTYLEQLVSQIPTYKDIDLLGQGKYELWRQGFLSPTVGAIDLVLKDMFDVNNNLEDKLSQKLNLQGKVVAVIGQGKLVGSPLLGYLESRSASIISLNKFTSNPQELCKLGDVVVSAAGKPNLVNKEWIKSKSIIIDASTSEENGSLVGDVDYTNMREDIMLCPSPNGIGKLTVLYLFYNLLKLHTRKI